MAIYALFRLIGVHISDHIFLDCSLAALLQAEGMSLCRSMMACFPSQADCVPGRTTKNAKKPLERFAVLFFLFMLCLLLWSLLLGDAFFTSVYYHPPLEISASFLAGCALFQVPVALWMVLVRGNNENSPAVVQLEPLMD
eukprot:jgi/Mesvir1/10102/Mv06975-RA.1